MKYSTKRKLLFSLLFWWAVALPFPAKTIRRSPSRYSSIFDSGAVSRRHYEINGKKEGLMTDYYPDGKVRGERHFINDLQTGKSIFFHPDGQVKEVQYFDQNGLKEGADSTFYPSGKPQMMVTFHKGQKHGFVRKWSENGELIFEAKYEMEKLVEVKGEKLKS